VAALSSLTDALSIMARYRARISSPMGQAAAFGYMAAFENVSAWDPGVDEAHRPTDGPLALGSTFLVQARFGSRKIPLTYRIIAFEEPRRVVLEAETKVLHSVDEIRVEPDQDGSVVFYGARLELRGAWRAASPLLALAFTRIGGRAHDGLARELSR
jgi:hypothetical protein